MIPWIWVDGVRISMLRVFGVRVRLVVVPAFQMVWAAATLPPTFIVPQVKVRVPVPEMLFTLPVRVWPLQFQVPVVRVKPPFWIVEPPMERLSFC